MKFRRIWIVLASLALVAATAAASGVEEADIYYPRAQAEVMITALAKDIGGRADLEVRIRKQPLAIPQEVWVQLRDLLLSVDCTPKCGTPFCCVPDLLPAYPKTAGFGCNLGCCGSPVLDYGSYLQLTSTIRGVGILWIICCEF